MQELFNFSSKRGLYTLNCTILHSCAGEDIIVNLTAHKNMVGEMFESVGQAVGIHVLLLVIEHAHWKIKQKYDEADLIHFSEEGVNLDRLDELEPARANMVAHEFIMLVVATLGRLVGKQLARQLTEQLQDDCLEKEA
jgi:hypothetical protein